MKLSDIKGERVLDVIAEIAEPLSVIAADEAAKSLFEKKSCPDGMTPGEFTVKRLVENVPELIRGHKREIITVMAAIEGVSYDQYVDELNVVKLVKDVTEILSDKEFLAFFS